MGGRLVCSFCSIGEDETTDYFECDHIFPLEANGMLPGLAEHEWENTRPLCHSCHQLRQIEQARVRHARGEPARLGGSV